MNDINKLYFNLVKYNNYKRICIIDGENLRGYWNYKTKTKDFKLSDKDYDKLLDTSLLKSLGKKKNLHNINLIHIFFHYIEKYNRNTLYIIVTKNRYYYKCVIEESSYYKYSNIIINYLCSKNTKLVEREYYSLGEPPKRICWSKDFAKQSHSYCEYDDFIIYYILSIFNMIKKKNKNINVDIYSNDKEFSEIESIERFKDIDFANFSLMIYNIVNEQTNMLYNKNITKRLFEYIYRQVINNKKLEKIRYERKLIRF